MPSRSESLKLFSITAILFSIIMWSLSFPLIKIALGGIPPITLAAIRFLIATIPLLIVITIREGWKGITMPLKKDWRVFFSLGILLFTLPNIFQNIGMTLMSQETAASVTSIIQCSTPIFTIVLALFFLHESFGIKKFFGTTLALSGAILLVTEGGTTFSGSGVVGNSLILLSAISYSISGVISKQALSRHRPITLLALSCLIGSLFLAILSPITEPIHRVASLSLDLWLIVLFLGLLAGSLPSLLWYMVLEKTELSRLTLFVYLIPVFAPLFSYITIGEIISWQTILFAMLVIGGVTIAQIEKKSGKK